MLNNRQVAQSLRVEKQKLANAMKGVRNQLAMIKKGELDPNTPFIHARPGRSIADLMTPHRNLQEALRAELRNLRKLIKGVKAKQHHAWTAAARHRVAYTKAKLKNHLKNMEKDGVVDAGELEQAQKLADSVLKQNVGLLNSNPSTSNIENVLNAIADTQYLGSDPDKGSDAMALRALATAGEKRHAASEKKFRRTPTSKNFGKTLEEEGLAAMLGSKLSPRKGWKPAGNIRHTYKKGETLSGISMKYYGSYGYWDVIYRSNMDMIGYNPDLPQLDGVELIIP